MPKMFWGPLSAAALIFLCSCSGTPPLGGSANIAVVEGKALPEPLSVNNSSNYTIGAFDVLTIGVLGITELAPREVQVDGRGMISFPMVGPLQASGHTPGQLESAITQGLRAAFIRNPQVTVNLKDMNSNNVTLDGQVKLPGIYPALEGMTLMQAIAQAQGLTEFAKLDDVVVFRNLDGKRYAALYNMTLIRRGAYDDPRLFKDDIVVVGNSPARQIFRDILQITPLLSGPLVIALQN